MRAVRFAAILLILSVANSALAWGPGGHMVVAEIAYRQLSASDRAKAVQVLKAAFAAGADGLHQFEMDLTTGAPAGASPDDLDHYIFIKAATWPDIIREETHPLHHEFHESSWHFINLPFVPHGDTITPPQTPVPTPAGMEPKDIISALRLCSGEFKSPATSKRVRAARLCFLLHMVGDIHQPLHASAMFSNDKLPHGDQGGNKLLVRIPGDSSAHDRLTSIHSIFDGLFGHDTRLNTIVTFGERIDHTPGLTPQAQQAQRGITDPMEWAKESLKDAIEVAYLRGHIKALRGLTVEEFHNQQAIKLSDVPVIGPHYESNAHPVGDRRVAISGYRLADLLAKLLAP